MNSNTNLFASRHFKRKKVSLLVDVRRSKTSLRKLPISSQHSRSSDNKLNNMSLMSLELSGGLCVHYLHCGHACSLIPAVSKFGETHFRPQYLRFWLRAYKAAFFFPWRSCAEEIWCRDCGETLSGVVVTTSFTNANGRLFWGEGDGKERKRETALGTMTRKYHLS